ncbi:hypothetical protein P1P75_41105, partial [Streptomyces sp. ID05-39B]|uniref:hypothetical protein n=1 Tax=Streptomyces sp. ID05-39B TaxID=3028664 RepID=UPI0029A1D50C
GGGGGPWRRTVDSPDSGGNQDKKRLACPSGPCHEGGSVIGVMTEQGRLAYLPMPVVMDAAFVAGLQEAGYPERRYRFSRPCVESACSQWTGRGCAVVDHVLDEPSDGGCAGHRPPWSREDHGRRAGSGGTADGSPSAARQPA